MVKRLLSAMESADSVAVASCFAETSQFLDFCPCVNGHEAYAIHGSKAVELLFRSLFAVKRLIVSVPEAENDLSGTYYGAYEGGPYIYARIIITETDESGLIRRAVVSPA